MISVCAIIRDEEKNIRGMIDNCLPYLQEEDELVIIDGGSTDNTIKIIKEEYSDERIVLFEIEQKFEKRKWINEDEIRNVAWGRCTHDWIISLDCDEAYSPELYQNIDLIIECNPYATAFHFPTINFAGSTKKIYKLGSWPDYHIRLANRNFFKWVGKIHASLWYEGKHPVLPGDPKAKVLDYFLYHYARVKENIKRDYGKIPDVAVVDFTGYHPRREFDD